MKHMLSSALIAGLVAGLLSALLQFVLVEPDIILAERYETGELTQFTAATAGTHQHDHSATTATEDPAITAEPAAEPAPEAVGKGPFLSRPVLTVLFTVLTYCGYALILLAGIRLAESLDVTIGPSQALLWGLAGFLAFQMMPALGVAPELPGTPAADLQARQYWWFATAASTAIGLWLLVYGPASWQRVLGAGLLIAPHAEGAPKSPGFGGVVPPELAASFAAHSLGVGLITWVVLAWVLVRLWHHDPTPDPAP